MYIMICTRKSPGPFFFESIDNTGIAFQIRRGYENVLVSSLIGCLTF